MEGRQRREIDKVIDLSTILITQTFYLLGKFEIYYIYTYIIQVFNKSDQDISDSLIPINLSTLASSLKYGNMESLLRKRGWKTRSPLKESGKSGKT